MREKYYTATEAAEKLRLEYHTFMWRVRKQKYDCERWGGIYVFERRYIDRLSKKNEGRNAAAHRLMAETTR